MYRTAAVEVIAVVGLCFSLAACSDTTSCARSKALADGSVASVDVKVAAKGPDKYLSTIDVNGGLYAGPYRTSATGGTGALTDLAVGNYPGKVKRAGDELTLTVRQQTIPLNGPWECD